MVGEQVRRIRKSRGMTQERLADLSGLSFSYISDVERGTRNISLESLGRIIEALGTKPAQLFAEPASSEILLSDTEDKLATLTLLLSDRSADEVEFIIKVAQEFMNTLDRKKT
ncbi:HTH-type transcriptional regulator PuuR [compost metagenome]